MNESVNVVSQCEINKSIYVSIYEWTIMAPGSQSLENLPG